MVASNFARAMPYELAYEGKFANHKDDPGGRTYEGVTQRVWDAYCELNGLPRRQLSPQTGSWSDWPKHRNAIYKEQYWDVVQGDKLPAGIDLVVFDRSILSGTDRAVRILQKALRLNNVDGTVGKVTLAALANHPDHDLLVAEFCKQSQSFIRQIRHYKSFAKGWEARIAAVKKVAQAWATGSVGPRPAPIDAPMGKALDEDVKTPPPKAPGDIAATAGGIGVGTGTTDSGGVGPVLDTVKESLAPLAGHGIADNLILAVTVASAVLLIGGLAYRWWATRKTSQIKEALA